MRSGGYVIKGGWGYYGGCDSYCRWYSDPKEAEVFPTREEAEAVARDVLPLGEYFIFKVLITGGY